MEQEIWKPVLGYEGRYEVSSLGRVKTLPGRVRLSEHTRPLPEKIRTGALDRHGYRYVILYDKDTARRPKRVGVHRLVAMVFLPKSEPHKHVNHKNFVRDDNRPENLEWTTAAENVRYSAKAGHMSLLKVKRSTGKTTLEMYAEVRRLLLEGELNNSEISAKTGVPLSTVVRCAAGKALSCASEPVRLVASSPWEQAGRRRKLSPDQVARIRELGGTMPNPAIAAMFGVAAPTVWGILNGKYWKVPA